MAFGLKFAVSVATLVCLVGFVSSNEDIADGEDGYMDTAVERAVIEVSCSSETKKNPGGQMTIYPVSFCIRLVANTTAHQ